MLPTLTKQLRGAQTLEQTTVRDFSGGLNVLDEDLNLNTKFSRKLYNVFINSDNNPHVRFGTQLFCNCAAYTTSAAGIVNAEYFNGVIVVVMTNGEVLVVFGDGSCTRVFDNIIAHALTGSPSAWSATTFCSFAQFNGELIIANGVDKPLIVRAGLTVEYLHDEGTGSNVNTPIARYVATCLRYLIFAGDPQYPNRVHISARDTSGTFVGDPAPNDAVFTDVGSILENSTYIRGIRGFRDKLIVAYAEGTVLGALGTYDATVTPAVHKPNFDDAVQQYGSIAHRDMVSYGDDMLLMDLVGMPSLKRTVFTGTIRPERVSDLIDPQVASLLAKLSYGTLEDRTFALYNQRDGQFMFFIPNGDSYATTTQTTGFVYTFRPSLKVQSWARVDGWNWTCGVRSLQGNVFFGDHAGKLWLYGNVDNPIYSDFIGDNTINGGLGIAITFDWELPWFDFNKRTRKKKSKYIALDTRGTAEFSISMYVDRFVLDKNGADSPLLTMQMIGGDAGGYGNGSQPYGGGRNTANEQLYAWPADFMYGKLRFRGQTTEPLSFTSISLYYQMGGIHR